MGDKSEYEIYRVGVFGARTVLLADLDAAQEYAEEQLDYDTVEWRFSEGDEDLMHGLVDDELFGDIAAVEIFRDQLFHDPETASKWVKKQERKNNE